MKFKIFTLAFLALCGFSALADNSYGIPDNIQDSNILHCFDWTFNDIKSELPNIAEAGFGAIQVSPVQGNCSNNAEWFYAYMPYDFCFRSNGNGSRTALTQLCEEADKYGIKIIVDVVANHINQASGFHDTWWDSNGRIRWEGSVDYGNRYSITHGQVGDYGDVNSESSEVQQRCKDFLNELKGIGVKGIRWDAAKHIGLPSENCNFWSEMASVAGLWHYGEILDGPGGDKYTLLKEYCKYIGVTDTEYSKTTINQVNSGSVPSNSSSWAANGVPAENIVYWAESHDDYSNDGSYGTNSSNISQDKMDRAYAIVACRNKETALYFSRPSATTRSTIRMGQKGSTHFTSKQVAEVNKFRNAMVGKADYYSQQNGVACITRQDGGAVIVKGSGSGSVSVPNGGGYVPAGTYEDRVSGATFTVTNSTISGNVGSTGIAVIYGEVKKDPYVSLSPNGGTFVNTVTVTATAGNCTSAWYKIGNGSQTSINGTATFTLGADMEIGDKVTVSWSATGEEGTKTGQATFSKIEQPKNAYCYLKNTDNWSVPAVWAWTDAQNCTASGSWPGDQMTKQSDGKYLWTAPTGKTPDKIIFSDNGNNQTADLAFENGATYDCSGTIVEAGNGEIPDDPTVNPGNDDFAVYFDNSSSNWDTVMVHYWGGDSQSTWPGATMSPYYEKVYKYVVPDNTTGLVFNNGNGTQTGDFTAIKGHLYTMNGDQGVYDDPYASVESIIDDQIQTPVYYNLQGIRVSKPTHGIYILNGKKILIK
jgi:alpha-amylase